MKLRTLVWALVCGMLIASAGVARAQMPVTIQQTINLVNVWTDNNVWANDFHIRFKATNLQNEAITPSYLDNGGFWNVLPGVESVDRVVSYTQDGYVDIYYSWEPPICVNASDPGQFGFTLLGGVQYQDVEWNWTLNGAPVQDQDDVWQDWIKVWSPENNRYELRDVIRNRETAPLMVQRTTGFLAAPVTIAQVAATPVGLLPNPQPIDPGPIVVDPGDIVVQPWPWPGIDPSYYMYYDLYNGNGQMEASFRNVAVLGVPEPGVLALLLTGVASVLGLSRLRK